MNPSQYRIIPYSPPLRPEIMQIWESSVRSTHHFLAAADIEFFKDIVSNIDFGTFMLYCIEVNNKVLGFVGVAGQKIEMLFLAPAQIGKGLGSALLRFAVQALGASLVDMNEQNHNAVRFYTRNGFSPFDRKETDSSGKPYPILEMSLQPAS